MRRKNPMFVILFASLLFACGEAGLCMAGIPGAPQASAVAVIDGDSVRQDGGWAVVSRLASLHVGAPELREYRFEAVLELAAADTRRPVRIALLPGLEGDTAVVFTTDHGHFLGQHGLTAKGAFLYEDMVKVPFLTRIPGGAGAGGRCTAMQSLVDLAPTFLSLAGVEIPRTMTGIDESGVWRGECRQARDHVIVENRHQPSTIHQRCFIDQRYKITVYYGHSYGEMFDLQEDPYECRNLWNHPSARPLKEELLLKLIQAELGKEPIWMPRVCGA